MEIKTQIPDFVLREATEADVPLILSFIRELAEYEKLAHEVVATEDVLRESLFGDRKIAEVCRQLPALHQSRSGCLGSDHIGGPGFQPERYGCVQWVLQP